MRKFFVLYIYCFFILSNLYSQDKLYITSGTKIQCKISEISSTQIKYKDITNLDGPNYVILRSDVVMIEYANGVVDVINDNPPNILPKTEIVKPSLNVPEPNSKKTITKPKKDFNLYYLNPNFISINALALANGDLTLFYDRDLLNNRLSLTFLGGYNFNPRMGGLNLFIADSKSAAKKLYDFGAGVNFMPRNTARVQYFAGILTKYMAYNYQEVIDTTNNQKKFINAKGYQFAIMISNGWLFRISPDFSFKLFGSIGVPINSTPLNSSYRGIPKVYLGYCFGYRF